jgi:hypothetical protein
MDNVLYNQELQLSRFGEYLLRQRMTREGHESYTKGVTHPNPIP